MKVISKYETKCGVYALVYDYSDCTYCVIIDTDTKTMCRAYFSLQSAERAFNELLDTIEE